jgi:selenocysteine lyase/cysteine desulfurase
LRAAIEFVNEVGVDGIAAEVLARADQIAAGVTQRGYEVLGVRTPETASGIVSFRKEGVDARVIVRRLREHGVIAAPRQGWVRTSPHFYVSPEEIERMLALV